MYFTLKSPLGFKAEFAFCKQQKRQTSPWVLIGTSREEKTHGNDVYQDVVPVVQ